MNKEAYLSELLQGLKSLPPDEQEDIMADYREHFEQAQLRGRSEQEVIIRLGNPRIIAREVLAQYRLQMAYKTPTFSNVINAVMATVSIGLFNIVIVFIPFVASLLLLAGVYGFAIFLLISPVLLIIQHLSLSVFISDFFFMLGLIGIGLLLMVAAVKVTGLYYKLVVRYLQFNLKVLRRV